MPNRSRKDTHVLGEGESETRHAPNSHRRGRTVFRFAVGITSMICVASFSLSFVALWDLASNIGLSHRVTWLFPVLIDGAILQSTIALVHLAWDETKQGKRDRLFFWVVMVFGAAASIWGNAYHAYTNAAPGFSPVVAAVIATIAPISLLLASHGLVVLARRGGETTEIIAELLESPIAETATTETLAENKAVVDIDRAEDADSGRVGPLEDASSGDADVLPMLATAGGGGRMERLEAQQALAAALQDNPDLHVPEFAPTVGWGVSTVYRWANDIRTGKIDFAAAV